MENEKLQIIYLLDRVYNLNKKGAALSFNFSRLGVDIVNENDGFKKVLNSNDFSGIYLNDDYTFYNPETVSEMLKALDKIEEELN